MAQMVIFNPKTYNTIDIDTNDKETVFNIFRRILRCKKIILFRVKLSLQKGVHIKMFCRGNCELCRVCFDDAVRFTYDQFRSMESQNVMFDEKEFYQNGGELPY